MIDDEEDDEIVEDYSAICPHCGYRCRDTWVWKEDKEWWRTVENCGELFSLLKLFV